jgi:DNA invertase Pin-like site-specific DNA recombinase
MIYAAEYVRMSTDQQDLSPTLQKEAIAAYAAAHGIRVVATYQDEGRSGLQIFNRRSMQRLLADVQQKDCGFTKILVYDVSRWGRFQNPDASAYYDYHCRLNNVEVVYVMESFSNDDSPMMSVVKSLKRAMAAEYSRELAHKSRAGQQKVLAMGFQMGQLPRIGLRRQSESASGSPKRVLEAGERKSMQSDRVRWTLGPEAEVTLVKRIFREYVEDDKTIVEIASTLAAEGVAAPDGRPFNKAVLRSLLGCDALAGHFVWGREENYQQRRILGQLPRVVVRDCLPAIVDAETWRLTQQKLKLRGGTSKSPQQLLDELMAAVARNPGVSTGNLAENGLSGLHAYKDAFGGMKQAYALIGRKGELGVAAQQLSRQRTGRVRTKLGADLVRLLSDGDECVTYRRICRTLTVGDFRIAIQLTWLKGRATVSNREWFIREIAPKWKGDSVLIVRMNDDETARDFFLVPHSQIENRSFPKWLGKRLTPACAKLRLQSAEQLRGGIFTAAGALPSLIKDSRKAAPEGHSDPDSLLPDTAQLHP